MPAASPLGNGKDLTVTLSLPSMLVINAELGFKKTATYVALVVILSTFAGLLFGMLP